MGNSKSVSLPIVLLFALTSLSAQADHLVLAAELSKLIRTHKVNIFPPGTGERLYLREEIPPGALDLDLRTKYRIPNVGTSIVAAYDDIYYIAGLLSVYDPFDEGIVFTNQGVHARYDDQNVTVFTYAEIAKWLPLTWDENHIYIRRGPGTAAVKISLAESDIPPVAMANIIEDLTRYVTVDRPNKAKSQADEFAAAKARRVRAARAASSQRRQNRQDSRTVAPTQIPERQRIENQCRLANTYYQQGKFSEATSIYRTIERSPFMTPAAQVYWGESLAMNLGNAGKDFPRARELWLAAGRAGDVRAYYNFGLCYVHGIYGFTEDDKHGIDLLRYSAKSGNVPAAAFLAETYLRGEHGQPVNRQLARQYAESVSERGFTDSDLVLAELRLGKDASADDRTEALRQFRQLATEGDAAAALAAGKILYEDAPITGEYALARRYLRQATPALDATGHRYLGTMYLDGEGGIADVSLARQHLSAANATTLLLTLEQSATSDKAIQKRLARELLQLADNGDIEAAYRTGGNYERARGFRPNRLKALTYYKLAAVAGHRKARIHFDRLRVN